MCIYIYIYLFIHEIIAIENDHCDNKQKAIENMRLKKHYITSDKHTKNCRKSPLWSIIEFNGPWFQLLVYLRVTKSNRGKYPAIMGEYDISNNNDIPLFFGVKKKTVKKKSCRFPTVKMGLMIFPIVLANFGGQLGITSPFSNTPITMGDEN